MTDTTRLEAALGRWLDEEGAVRPPDRLIHETRSRIAATPQRRAIGGRIFRPLPAGWPAVASLAVIGMLVVALASLSIYLRQTGPAESPSPSPVPTPSPIPSLTALQPYECVRSNGTCLGPLGAGVYETTTFQPTIRFAVPAGWSSTYDVPGQFDLRYGAGGQYTYPDGITFSDTLSVFVNPVAESSVDPLPLTGIGTSAAALSSWLAAHQDLISSTPAAVSVGGAPGFRMEISLPSGSRVAPDHCTTDHREPRCESLFVGADKSSSYGFGLVGPESAVVYLVDAPSGDTVMFVIDDVDGVNATDLFQAATPIVQSIGFVP